MLACISYPLIEGATPANYDSLMISHHAYGAIPKSLLKEP